MLSATGPAPTGPAPTRPAPTRPEPTRRALLKTAAWSTPIVLAAVAAPLAAASPVGQITVAYGQPYGQYWTTYDDDIGNIITGIVVTVMGNAGRPLANKQVTFEIVVPSGAVWQDTNNPKKGISANVWFVDCPTDAASKFRSGKNEDINSALKLRQKTFTTDADGKVSLSPSLGSGYLRKGSNGVKRDEGATTISVTAEGVTQSINLLVSSNGIEEELNIKGKDLEGTAYNYMRGAVPSGVGC